MRIRSVLPIVFILSVIGMQSSCKKAIQEKYEDAIIKMMTSGAWKVTLFKEGSNDITASFIGYYATFNENKTVVATNGSVSASGTWNGDFNTQIFTANFPTAGDPIQKLNGSWTILPSSTETLGKFTQTKGGVAYQMELTKY
jgi:hypothetical protein